MRKLELDFNIQRRHSAWAGWVLLLVGLVLWGEMGISTIKLQRELGGLEKTLVKNGLAGKKTRQNSVQSFTPAEMDHAHEIIARIAIPWDDLFKAVETVKADRVALIVLEPDPKTGKLLLRGEAADLPALLTYVARLGRTAQLHDVYLLRHEIKPGMNPSFPVAFSINARWGALP